MWEASISALQYFLDLEFWFFLVLATVVGLLIGVIPGLGGLVGVAVLLPFAVMLPPEYGLNFLMALSAVTFTGGGITAILLNIPGTSPNAATLIDGYPMACKGEAGRALGAALTSSGLGGIGSAFIALAMIPLVIPIIMAIGTAEMVFIILMGLMFIAVLGKGSMVNGLISGGIGLLISFIGVQATSGVPRFCFGSLFLYEGIPLVPLALGLFAVPEAVSLSMKRGDSVEQRVAVSGAGDVMEGVKDVFRHFWTWLTATVIGFIVGVIPGIGAEVATFVAYGQARQTSRHPELFGTGIVEGVIAPESADNAKEGGALLTTLALGVPGSSVMALLLGAMLMAGLTPGPAMLKEHLPLSLSLMWVIVASNVLAALICLPLAPFMSRIASIPYRILTPMILVLVFAGAFSSRGYFADLGVLLVFGAMGSVMKRFRYNRPALFLGFVLGFLFEKYFFIALAMDGIWFFTRPISLGLILCTIGLFLITPIRNRHRNRSGRGMKTDEA